jgi:probable rRNA maturation factor
VSSGSCPTELDVVIRASEGCPPLDREQLVRFLRSVAATERLSGEIGVWLCTDEEIASLHEEYLAVSGPTDVITFPAGDESGNGRYLGDIAASFDTATEQAADAGHSVGREIAFLCTHGVLHLAGYDDLDDAGRAAMLERQEALIREFERESGGAWQLTDDRC